MYYVYILESSLSRKFYKGYTENLKNRVKEHNERRVSSTKNGCPWKLVYYEAFICKKDALIEERFLKSGKGRERLKYLLKYSILE